MNVSAIIVTRGNVDLTPVLDSIPEEWEGIVWDNGEKLCGVGNHTREEARFYDVPDLSVYGRYAAIEYASHDLIYVQDDDVIVSDPQAIVDIWDEMETLARIEQSPDSAGFLVSNMPQEFRHDGYTDSCLVGFGACFHRDAPRRAFDLFKTRCNLLGSGPAEETVDYFRRTFDVVFTTLMPRVLVDVPKIDREFASGPDRMWKQVGHYGERVRMLELARQVRDA